MWYTKSVKKNLFRRGFTLMELLIFSALFVLMSMAFMTMLVGVARVQVNQYSAADINQESQALLQTLQRYLETASFVSSTPGVSVGDSETNPLALRMADPAKDPTFIYMKADALGIPRVFIKEKNTGTESAFTSEQVRVTSLQFIRRQNPPVGHDTVSFTFSLDFNADNPLKKLSRTVGSSVSRVQAAVFDDNLLPVSGNTYSLGDASLLWKSINNVVNFSGANVGIGKTPAALSTDPRLDVAGNIAVEGGVLLNTTGQTLPSCAGPPSLKGMIWFDFSVSTFKGCNGTSWVSL